MLVPGRTLLILVLREILCILLGSLWLYRSHNYYMFPRGGIWNICLLLLIYVSLLLFVIGPAKSIWNSLFGSDSVGSDVCLFFGMMGFKFLPVFVHCLHLCASATTSLWICGYQINWAK